MALQFGFDAEGGVCVVDHDLKDACRFPKGADEASKAENFPLTVARHVRANVMDPFIPLDIRKPIYEETCRLLGVKP